MLVVNSPPANADDAIDSGSIPGLGRSPGKGNGNPLQYFCLENSKGRGTWWATVDGVAKSQTQLSDWACIYTEATYETGPGPGTLCCSACSWTHLSWSGRIPGNRMGLGMAVCMCSLGKFRALKRETREHKSHFWGAWNKSKMLGSKGNLLSMRPVCSTPKGWAKHLSHPQPNSWTHPYPHHI